MAKNKVIATSANLDALKGALSALASRPTRRRGGAEEKAFITRTYDDLATELVEGGPGTAVPLFGGGIDFVDDAKLESIRQRVQRNLADPDRRPPHLRLTHAEVQVRSFPSQETFFNGEKIELPNSIVCTLLRRPDAAQIEETEEEEETAEAVETPTKPAARGRGGRR